MSSDDIFSTSKSSPKQIPIVKLEAVTPASIILNSSRDKL
jgi:hypothetical protein